MVSPPLWWSCVQGACSVPSLCSWHRAFAPSPSEVAVGFLVFSYLVVHILPPLCMHTAIFSPRQILCILLPEETFVQVQAEQKSVPGPRSQPVSVQADNLNVLAMVPE